MVKIIQANFPTELCDVDQWVNWKLEKRDGEPTKVLYSPSSHAKASSTNPKTWSPFKLTCDALARWPERYKGIGFVFSQHDPYLGIDFDKCVVNGKIDPAVWAWVLQLDSYAEYSPSGTGIHVFARAVMPGGKGRKHVERKIEMYDRARFFTVTGHHIEETPLTINECQPQLDVLYAELFPKQDKTNSSRVSDGAVNIDDVELLELMFASSNGGKIQRLWNGDCSDYPGPNGKPDHSSADQALCNYLAFWTNRDDARMDRMFRQSKLYRSKWERKDYRDGTIGKAIAVTHEGYSRKRQRSAGALTTIGDLPKEATTYINGNGSHHVADDIAKMLLEHPIHDHGNAEIVDALHPGRFAFCNELGWMHNTGSHWDTSSAEFEVNRAITKALIRRRTAAVEVEREDVVKGTVPNEAHKNSIKGMYRDIVAVTLSQFDSDPNVLNCINGVVDLRTGQLTTHTPSHRFTYCVETPYDPGADRSAWLNFLQGSVGDYQEIAEWLQMAVGYSLTGLTREECLFYIHGPSRGGKGTFTQAILTLLGSPLARGVDFSTFTRARDGDSQNFDLAPLRPARFISASESGRYSSLNEAVVKNITGNDPITAAYKHRDQFTYTPQFKIWLSSNHPAKGDVDDDAFWGRLRVIRFPNSHLGREDKRLKWRMCSPEVLPGILAWAVEGARLWHESSQGLITPYEVDQATRQQRAELDHVQQWLEECTVKKSGEAVTVPSLYKSYETWCEENGHTPKKAPSFGRALVSKGYESIRKKIGDVTHRAYRDLILRSSIHAVE